jgi:hypothetical protein
VDNTPSLIEVADKIFTIIGNAAGTFTPVLTTTNLFWGDQVKIPFTPAICVEPYERTTEFAGIGGAGRLEIIHEVHIIVYTAKLTDSQTNRRESDVMVEQVANILHTPGLGLTNSQAGNGAVLAGNVVRTSYGYAKRNTLRAARLVWQGKCKTSIVPVP